MRRRFNAKENGQKKLILSSLGNLREKYHSSNHLLLYFFTPDIKATIIGNPVAKKKAKMYWLRDMKFIPKISLLRSKKLAFNSVYCWKLRYKWNVRKMFHTNCSEPRNVICIDLVFLSLRRSACTLFLIHVTFFKKVTVRMFVI